eukprot:1284997-Amphidinium_carterae.3
MPAPSGSGGRKRSKTARVHFHFNDSERYWTLLLAFAAALADDMCWLLRSLVDLIRKHDEYRVLYLATGSPLNHGKCDVLRFGANAWSALLRDAVPPKHPMLFVSIVHELRYLGLPCIHLQLLGHVVLEGMIRCPLMASAASHVARSAWQEVEGTCNGVINSLKLGELPMLLETWPCCSWLNGLERYSVQLPSWLAITHPLAGWLGNSCWHAWHQACVQLQIVHNMGGLLADGTLSAVIRLKCVPSLQQTVRTWDALLHRKWHAHLPHSILGAHFFDRVALARLSSLYFLTQFHSPAASAALVRLLLGPQDVHARHCHPGNCCFCSGFHTASSWAHRILCGCFRPALCPMSVFSWLKLSLLMHTSSCSWLRPHAASVHSVHGEVTQLESVPDDMIDKKCPY